jgi:Ran GTPase-activating protein (RanGAP) involved in mRNA processing and transport
MGRTVIRRFLHEAHHWPELTVFRMARNGGGTASAGDYLEELGHFSDLEHLDLQNHHFSPFQVAMLGAQLWERTTLTKLYLGSIRIRGGFEYFDAAISTCIHLQELDISGNSIESKGVALFAHALSECTELVKLDISANGQIDTSAEDILVEMFTECCTSMMALNIRGLGASQDACEKIERGMIERGHKSEKRYIAVDNNNYYFTDASEAEESDSD